MLLSKKTKKRYAKKNMEETKMEDIHTLLQSTCDRIWVMRDETNKLV